jgi:hypothetical protein
MGTFGLLYFRTLRPILAWRAFWNLRTVYFFNYQFFFGSRWTADNWTRLYWISEYWGTTTTTTTTTHIYIYVYVHIVHLHATLAAVLIYITIHKNLVAKFSTFRQNSCKLMICTSISTWAFRFLLPPRSLYFCTLRNPLTTQTVVTTTHT